MDQLWANRAASAEAAITKRHLKKLWGVPGTQLGVVAWPPARKYRKFGTWHYWWQAHLLDCLVDAQVRDPQPERVTEDRPADPRAPAAQQPAAGPTTTTTTWRGWRWPSSGRGGSPASSGPRRWRSSSEQFLNAWVPEDGGGIPWRKQDQFFNAPANGPAGIFLARYDDRLRRAQQMADWIDETLIDPETHLVFDGIKAGSMVRAQYTYCQGVVLGLETELAVRPRMRDHAQRVHRLVAAVRDNMAPEASSRARAAATAVCSTAILARYLALVATRCRSDGRRRRTPATPPGGWCSSPRRRPGTTGRPSRACRCSARSGTAPPRCPLRQARTPSSSRARSTPRRFPNATCRCSCRAGC